MDNKSKYGTNFILKDHENDIRNGLKPEDEDTVPCVSPNDDDYLLNEKKHYMTSQSISKWRKAAIAISLVSLVCTFVIGVTAFSMSSVAKSSAAFGFAFDSLLDVLSTLVVLWRFVGDKGQTLTWDRERRACIVMGVCFIVSSLGILVRAVRSLIVDRHPHEFIGIQIISGVCLVVFSVLAWMKFVVAERLSSSSLKTDGFSSLAGAVMALGLLMSSLSYEENKSVWFLDAAIALCISVCLGAYAVRLLSQMIKPLPSKRSRVDTED
ncbi:transmembrane protein 163-like [Actinia tenebrosa]|uniref:Transmembrane protein 163-like n=1 Tax=Actinia tenebrosa TaxID=6105 RepID=A0A6P8J2Y2_ACTTE|nr:transmembrane protein 163-like [Actinia tenebrosa]